MELPAEIREIIWAKAVNPFHPFPAQIDPVDGILNTVQALRRACREIDQEVSVYFFTSSGFFISSSRAWRGRMWLRRIGARNRLLIRKLILNADHAPWASESQALRERVSKMPDDAFLAAENWAALLRELPNLHRLRFTHDLAGSTYWHGMFMTQHSSDILPSSSLYTAIKKMASLHTLEIPCIDVDALHNIVALHPLQSLRVTRLYRYCEHNREGIEYDNLTLPYLQVGMDSQISWVCENIIYPRLFKSQRTYNQVMTKHQLTPLIMEGFTFKFSQLPNLGVDRVVSVSSGAFHTLVSRCTKLEYLGLSLDDTEVDRFDCFPGSIETLVLKLIGRFNGQAFMSKLREVRQRCAKLRSLTVFIDCEKRRRVPMPAALITRYKTMFQCLQDLSREGIETHCVVMSMRRE